MHSFPNTPFSKLVLEFIDSNGKLAPLSKRVDLFRRRGYDRRTKALDTLCDLVGEKVNRVNAIDANPSRAQRLFFKNIDQITKKHFVQTNFKVTDAMNVLLRWKNGRLNKVLKKCREDTTGNFRFEFRYCAFHAALRNAWRHPSNRPDVITNAIVWKCCPESVDDLIGNILQLQNLQT